MIVETESQELIVAAPLEQGPLVIIQDIELVYVGGGTGSSCHF